MSTRRARHSFTSDATDGEVCSRTKGFISRVEREQTSPSVASLVKLCRALRVDIGDLFEEPDTLHAQGPAQLHE